MADILAFVEQRGGVLRKVSQEVVTAARTVAEQVGGETHALALGPNGFAGRVDALGRFGADRIWVGESDSLEPYSPEGYVRAAADFLREHDYFAVFLPASALGKDLAPRLAARLDVPLATEATALALEGDELVITRPVYAGKAFAQITLDGSPRVVSLRGNVFTPEERPGAGAVERFDVAADPGEWRVRVRELVASAGETLDVGEAPVVVSGGRGLRGPENWELLETLRDAFGSGATLGASRAVVDAGWRPHAEQVGQTGKTVSPRLYVAVGISGAIQHLAGMRTAGTIVAINKDPDAPIFQVADYGIVGDAFDVVPRLAEELRKVRAE